MKRSELKKIIKETIKEASNLKNLSMKLAQELMKKYGSKIQLILDKAIEEAVSTIEFEGNPFKKDKIIKEFKFDLAEQFVYRLINKYR